MQIEKIISQMSANINFAELSRSYRNLCQVAGQGAFRRQQFEHKLLSLLMVKSPAETISELVRGFEYQELIRNLIRCYVKAEAQNQEFRSRICAAKLLAAKIDDPRDAINESSYDDEFEDEEWFEEDGLEYEKETNRTHSKPSLLRDEEIPF